MEDKLRNFLDKIYELEGLVHLALHRDNSSPHFLELIEKKGEEIAKLCSIFNNKEVTESKKEEYLTTISEGQNLQSGLPFSLEEYTLEEPERTEDNQSFPKKPSNSDRAPLEERHGKLVFSINERFRFKKELFGNSDADFNNTLALVASMEDYEEAENYFINEEGLEIRNPVVTEFLGVIKRYFQ